MSLFHGSHIAYERLAANAECLTSCLRVASDSQEGKADGLRHERSSEFDPDTSVYQDKEIASSE